MSLEEGVNWMVQMLRDAIYEGASFLIFNNPDSDRFVQFAFIGREGWSATSRLPDSRRTTG